MSFKRSVLAAFAALSLTASPALAQPTTPAPSEDTQLDRNFDPNILLYIALPAVIAIILVVAASGSQDRPVSP